MSSIEVQSDYTSKDFLQKLIGKSTHPQLTPTLNQKLNQIHIDSESTIEDNNSQKLLTQRCPSNKHFHFNSIQNSSSKLTLVFQRKSSIQSKQNLRRKTINKQSKQFFKLAGPDQCKKDQKIQFCSSSKCSFSAKDQRQTLQTKKLTIQSEIMQKAKVILRSILINKINTEQLNHIIHSFEQEIHGQQEYNKLVESCNKIKNHKNALRSQNEILKSKPKSLSLQLQKDISLSEKIRFQSSKKASIHKNSLKQIKLINQKSKQQILKQIKKIKQLVFLNQKSLNKIRRRTQNFLLIN